MSAEPTAAEVAEQLGCAKCRRARRTAVAMVFEPCRGCRLTDDEFPDSWVAGATYWNAFLTAEGLPFIAIRTPAILHFGETLATPEHVYLPRWLREALAATHFNAKRADKTEARRAWGAALRKVEADPVLRDALVVTAHLLTRVASTQARASRMRTWLFTATEIPRPYLRSSSPRKAR